MRNAAGGRLARAPACSPRARARDERISRLEMTLQHHEETRLLMMNEQEALMRQLEDARLLVQRVQTTRQAREQAEAEARALLAGPPSAQELLERELNDLQEAESRAREAREARRDAAVRRKAAIDAELEASQALHGNPQLSAVTADGSEVGNGAAASPSRNAAATAPAALIAARDLPDAPTPGSTKEAHAERPRTRACRPWRSRLLYRSSKRLLRLHRPDR